MEHYDDPNDSIFISILLHNSEFRILNSEFRISKFVEQTERLIILFISIVQTFE